MRSPNQHALTIRTGAPRRGLGRPRRDAPLDDLLTAPEDALLRTGSKLPDRYWIQGPNRLWSSVPRGSAAHRADRKLCGL